MNLSFAVPFIEMRVVKGETNVLGTYSKYVILQLCTEDIRIDVNFPHTFLIDQTYHLSGFIITIVAQLIIKVYLPSYLSVSFYHLSNFGLFLEPHE